MHALFISGTQRERGRNAGLWPIMCRNCQGDGKYVTVEWTSSYKYSYFGLFPLPRGVFDPGTYRMWARRLPQCGVASPGFLASLCATSWRRGTVATDSSIVHPSCLISSWYIFTPTHIWDTLLVPVLVFSSWIFRFYFTNFGTAQKPSPLILLNSGTWGEYGQHKYTELNLRDSLSTSLPYTIRFACFASVEYIAIGYDCCFLPLQVSQQNCCTT